MILPTLVRNGLVATFLALATTTAVSAQQRAIVRRSADGAVRPAAVTIQTLSINTAGFEYAPMIAPDGSTLYFASDRSGGFGGHDIWAATRADGEVVSFVDVRNVGSGVNTSDNEGAVAVTASGTLYFSACNRPDGLGDCDIYVADLVEGIPVNARNVTELNSPNWDSQPTVSADGRVIYFASNREGALGGSGDIDIWYAELQDDGRWSAPRNAGSPINSTSREDSPFLHAAGEHLFFSTAGRDGFGGLDFVVSVRSGAGWSMPVNLGSPLNTTRDERFITVSPGLTEAYFASERTTPRNEGKLDIFVATALDMLTGAPDDRTQEAPAMSIAPNPARDIVTIERSGDATSTEATIVDALGRTVLRATVGARRTALDLRSIPTGLYSMRADGRTATLIVRR